MPAVARKIFVISDLHLGGRAEIGKRGFRLCTHEAELAGFIDQLTGISAPPLVELVLNGDIVDFLAEETGEDPRWSPFHFPESKALQHFDGIVRRSSIVFDALKRFLAAPGHRLVILPGNHDIELNLPAVRRRLREAVGASGPADYEYLTGGEAYLAGKDLLIEHGNRVDNMNFVDYSVLRHVCGLLSRDLPVKPEARFEPPAGSRMVAEVLNPIKEHYSFIDLLKPEAEAAFPVILALEPGRRGELAKVAGLMIKARELRDRQLARNFESDIAALPSAPSVPKAPAPDPLGDILERTVGRRDFALAPPSRSGEGVAQISALSMLSSFWTLLTGHKDESWQHRLYDLLDALRAFQGPDCFDRSKESDPVYWKEAQWLGSGEGAVRHVVFGHTHLAKQVQLAQGYYFNSGTWADLLELPRGILDRSRDLLPLADLESFVQDLVAQNYSKYTLFRPTYVRCDQDEHGNTLRAGLYDYKPGEKLPQ